MELITLAVRTDWPSQNDGFANTSERIDWPRQNMGLITLAVRTDRTLLFISFNKTSASLIALLQILVPVRWLEAWQA